MFWNFGRARRCWSFGRPQRTDAAAVRGRFPPPSFTLEGGREGEEAIDRVRVHGGCISPVRRSFKVHLL